MRIKMKPLWLMAGAMLAAGCAKSDYPRMGPGRPGVNPKNDPAYLNAEDETPPKILPDTHFAAGLLFERQGQVDKAILQYRKAVVLNHNFANAYHRLGLTLSAVGRHDEAIEALRRAVELRPENPAVRNNLGFEYILTQRWDDAEQELERALDVQSDFARAHVNLGLVRARTGRFADALASFKQAMAEPDAYYNLGLTQRGQQRYAEAAESFRRVLDINPNFSAAKVQLDQLVDKITVVAPPTGEAVVEVTVEEAPTLEVPAEPQFDVLAMLADILEAQAQVAPTPTLVEPEQAKAEPCPEPEAVVEVAPIEFFEEETVEPIQEQVVEFFEEELDADLVVAEPTFTADETEPCELFEEEPIMSLDPTAEPDADFVVTGPTWIPAEPLTQPSSFRDSWVMLHELEDKVAMLRLEAAEPKTAVLGDRYEAESETAPTLTGEPTIEEPAMGLDPCVEPTSPTNVEPENAVPGDRRSEWSQDFGELSNLLAVVMNETRCWDALDAEFAAVEPPSSDEPDAFEPNAFVEEMNQQDDANDWADIRLAYPIP